MKKLFPSLVAVKKIVSAVPSSNFAEPDLEKLARLILDLGGLINPIIVRRTGMDSYEIVDGNFEYYAAARAKEIEPLKGETIGAFILEPENEELLLAQLEILRSGAVSESRGESATPEELSITESVGENPVSEPPSSFEQRLINIEARLENEINELKAEHAREKQVLAERIQEVENLFSQQLPVLIEAGLDRRIERLKLESEVAKPPAVEPESVTPSLSGAMPLLEALNNQDKAQLKASLEATTFLKAPVIQLILKERDVRPFVSFANVVERIKGLTDKTMIKIIDYWQNTHKL
ncbi:chromosome partitioning protein ParB [Tychonema sp. LEGE 07199]|uniref:ParB/Srx family N-terminal domain-containing protein n=1 Tax=unclassified Tychonema TaxID=2642144 RepID=UPI0018816A66|nr:MULTISPECIES: ParB/Srx family N-terminal domain-containing protein [unclassified Tychonema]MBE9120432.1 chromosome partitioning protein ParB [Tychonema sp. LEGE 07199]MBE9131725.1 chromosome partitioning protein ParB [Tychonema sp. LEGE 07196]